MEAFTMEETIIITYVAAILVGILLGAILYVAFEHDNNKQEW